MGFFISFVECFFLCILSEKTFLVQMEYLDENFTIHIKFLEFFFIENVTSVNTEIIKLVSHVLQWFFLLFSPKYVWGFFKNYSIKITLNELYTKRSWKQLLYTYNIYFSRFSAVFNDISYFKCLKDEPIAWKRANVGTWTRIIVQCTDVNTEIIKLLPCVLQWVFF